MQKEFNSSDLQHTSCQTDLDAQSFPYEALPTFQLRLDEASGLDEQSWIQTPVLSPDVKINLSPEQCEETFKFFLLSGDRLSQMTRTYHDIDALMHLLEEKERDLELVARIGQTLLNKNRQVAEQNELLEEKLAVALEESSQIRYELSKKEKLLHIYTEDEFSATKEEIDEFNNLQLQVTDLNTKIAKLEKDKSNLVKEQHLMQFKSKENQEKDRNLVSSTVEQLSVLQSDLKMANSQILAVTDELNKRDTESNKQQGDISLLLKQITELQSKHAHLITEHEELQQQLHDANSSQFELSQEVQTLENKYQDVLGMLDDTREEMKIFRDSTLPSEADSTEFELSHGWNTPIPYENSLAAELKSSEQLFDSISELDESIADDKDRPSLLNYTYPSASTSKAERSILKTVHYANIRKEATNDSPNISMSRSLPLTLQKSSVAHKQKVLTENTTSLDSPSLGQPGIPGTSDLQRAIEKLTRFGKESLNFVHQTRLHLQQAKKGDESSIKKSSSVPKLQIVKPLEGSMTLHVWQSLANKGALFPTLSKNPTMSPSGIITRGSWLQQQKFQHRCSPNAENCLDIDKKKSSEVTSGHATTSGTSGVLLTAASRNELLQNTLVKGNSGVISCRSRGSHSIKSVQSSPHLPSLAAALLPSTTSHSILHAVSHSGITKINPPSTLDLSQLHGCDEQSSSNSSS